MESGLEAVPQGPRVFGIQRRGRRFPARRRRGIGHVLENRCDVLPHVRYPQGAFHVLLEKSPRSLRDARVPKVRPVPEGTSSCVTNLSSLSPSAPPAPKPVSRSSGSVIVWAAPVEGASVITSPSMDIV